MHSASFYVLVGGNDIFWRVEAPAKAVGAKMTQISEEEAPKALLAPNKDTAFPWGIRVTKDDGTEAVIHTPIGWKRFTNKAPAIQGMSAFFPQHEGAAIFTRPTLSQAILAKAMRSQGIRTIAESDDNYFADKNMNLFMRQQDFNEETRDFHAKAFASHEACVFSTEWLRDRYYKEFRARFGKQGLPELHVCHNNIDLKMWPERIERNGPLRVGFMGSTSHVWDVNLAYGAFHLAHEYGCETHFIGYNPANPDPNMPEDKIVVDGEEVQMRSEKSKENIRKWKAVITKHTKWITPDEYHRASLPLDVGLCPLRSDDFTLGKSDVKAIEYTISGAAVICTNNPVYNGFWKHEVNCLMANSPEEFGMATLRLIKDSKLRYELVTNAQEKVLKERGLPQMKWEWNAAING